VDIWTFIWLMAFLKIPVLALFLIVRWAVRQVPESAGGEDGGIGPPLRPYPHHHPRRRPPRPPRRGPHGDPPPASPARARGLSPRRRITCA